MSNYLLYLVFVTTTIAYYYFSVQLSFSSTSCHASPISDKPVPQNSGRDVKKNFVAICTIGAICGTLEILRNSINLWAKCFNYQKLAIIFQVLGFITAFLFVFNFIMMQLYRFTHAGRVCSGDFLYNPDRDAKENYLIEAGYFINVLIWTYYSMIAVILLSVSCVAFSTSVRKPVEPDF